MTGIFFFRRRRFAIGLVLLVGMAIPGSGQTARDATQKFEVASVRLEDPKDPHSSLEYTNTPQFRVVQTVFPSNRLTIRHATLRILINQASGIQSNHVLGGPDWVDHQRYEIDAKVEGDARLTQEQMRPLLRNLLEERFHLKVHPEQRIVPGYALVVAKGGAKLQPNKGAPFSGMYGGYMLKRQNCSVEDFAGALVGPAGGPVIDRTGIKGMYDFDLKFGPHGFDDPAFAYVSEDLRAELNNLPDIFTVLQEKYGLRLVPEKIPVDYLIVDGVERVPTEN